ncbi:MAG: hypothetical protein KGV51_07685 [Moraxellaceae bacterium]|nr:hypothetical protein [Moraxellaceae bacterium]
MHLRNFTLILMIVGLSGCQVLPDKYEQEANPNLIKLDFRGYSTGSRYIGVPIPDKKNKYHMKIIDTRIAYIKPDADYAIKSSGHVPHGICEWTYIIHTPKLPQTLTIYAKHTKGKIFRAGKCHVTATTSSQNINQSGFTLRKPKKQEKFKY